MSDRTVRLFPQKDGSLLGLMPVPATHAAGKFRITFAGPDDTAVQTIVTRVLPTHFASQNVSLASAIEALHSTPEEMAELMAFKQAVTDTRYWEDRFVAPVDGCVTSPYGVKRLRNGKPTGEYHGGVDQRATSGEEIRAFAAGTVKFSHPFNVLGGAVGIDHGQGLETMYLHMSKIAVEAGARVDRGDVIGYAGSTGRSTGPHLHWVVYVNGVQVNPAQWVSLKSCSARVHGKKSQR
jgi:murein DD-endopeptidase MepM/ murein hydrolase activator NlpD